MVNMQNSVAKGLQQHGKITYMYQKFIFVSFPHQGIYSVHVEMRCLSRIHSQARVNFNIQESVISTIDNRIQCTGLD